MSGKSTAAFGIFSDRQSVEDALISLRNEGFRSTDISILFPDNVGTRNFAHEKKTQAPAGATAGGGTGIVLGGALGWLTGIGALTIPGMGPFLASGPIVAALAGAGVGGALGGIMGALIGFGVPEYDAKRYEGRVAKGGILMSVHCDDSEWTRKAKQILDENGAEDISSAGETESDVSNSDRTLPRQNQASGATRPQNPSR